MQLRIQALINNTKGEGMAYSAKEIIIPLGTAKTRRKQEDIDVDIAQAAILFNTVDKTVGGFDPVGQVETIAAAKLHDYTELKRYKEFILGWFSHANETPEWKEFVEKISASFNKSDEKQEITNRLKRI